MKKRVLSALLVLCMACTLAGNVWAAEETEPTPAPSAGVEVQTVEPQTVEPTPSAEPTQAPAPSPDATAEPEATEATPEPSVAPSAAPDATVEPDVTPAPTEAPEATAAPAATATPDATAEPTATPAPTEAPAATATPEPSDAPEATAAPAVAYVAPVQTAEDQQINVHVDVPEGAFAENVAPTLHAQLITGETEEEQAELDKAAAQVAEQTGAAFDGMLALDVYFTDANAEDPEQEIEPALPVSVRLELSENVLPEGYDPATLAVHHLAEEKDAAGEPVTDENGEAAVTVETVANAVTDDAEVPGVVALSDAAAEAAEAPAEVARIADLPAPETAATPADEQAAAEAEQALTDPAVVAEFEVESFSVFTVSWSLSNDRYFDTLTVQRINVDGTGVGDDFVVNGRNSVSLTVQSIADAHPVAGYEFVGAVVASDPKQAWERQNQNNDYKVVRIRNDNKVWKYNDSNNRGNWRNIGTNTVYFLYRASGRLTIDDSDLLSEGRLLPKYADAALGSEYVYEWERKAENGNSWELVERRAVTEVNGENLYNVAEDGSWLNVSLDGGARYTYRVKLVSVDGTTGTGEIVSPEYKVPYYDSLQNGSFENPDANGEEKFVGSGTEDVVWKTTGRNDDNGSRIELVGNDTDTWHGVNFCPVDDIYKTSKQCAELNADSAGALYQDVLTTPGSTMYWSLMHNGRTRNEEYVGEDKNRDNPASDTMYVLVMSADLAMNSNDPSIDGEIDTQDEVQYVMNNLDQFPGASVTTITYQWYWDEETSGGGQWPGGQGETTYTLYMRSGQTDGTGHMQYTEWTKHEENSETGNVQTVWANHTGAYSVPENQYLTRYFFVSGETELGDDVIVDGQKVPYTVGNHIDNVHFSTTVPPAADGTATLTIQKAITGLTNDDYENLKDKLTFTVQYGSETITLYADSNDPYVAKMSWWGSVENGGTATGTYVIQNIPIPANGNVLYTVTEKISDATVDGYTLTTTPEATDENVSVAGTLGDRDSKTAAITNAYTSIAPAEPVDPVIHKYVDDNKDGTYDLSLDVTGDVNVKESVVPLNVLYILDESYSMMWDMNGNYPDKDVTNNRNVLYNKGGDNRYAFQDDNDDQDTDTSIDYTTGEGDRGQYSYARYNAAKGAIETLNEALAANTDLNVRVALVEFAAGLQKTSAGWQTLSDFNVPDTQYDLFATGTNYAAAFNEAARVLNESNGKLPNAKTVVIFITDGVPNRQGTGSETSANATVGIASGQEYLANVVDALKPGDSIYAIGVSNDVLQDGKNINLENLFYHKYENEQFGNTKVVPDTITSALYQSDDANTLAEAFREIAATVTGATYCTDVTITDTFSQYAEMVDVSAVPTITIKKADDTSVSVTAPQTLTAGVNGIYTGNYTFEDGGSQTLKYTYYPAGTLNNNEQPVFTLDFPDNYALADGWTYTITVGIKPTDTANNYYAEHKSYPDKGDKNTDASGNDTSSDQAGFYSNTSATLTYDSGDEQDKTKDYPKPVIQVKNGSLTIDKNVVSSETGFNVSALGDISFTFTVQGPEDVKSKTYGNVEFDENGVATVTIAKDGNLTIEGLPAGPYTVTETGKPDSQDGSYYCSGTTYQVGNGKKENQPQSATVSAGTEITVTVKNTYAKYRTVTITKQIGGEMGAKDNAFNFTTNVARSNEGTSYDNDIKSTTVVDGSMSLLNGEKTVGSVTVINSRTEEGAMNSSGYQLSHSDVLTIGKLKKGDTITIAETDANQNGYDTTYTINGAAEKTTYTAGITVTLDDTTLEAAKVDNIIPVVVYNDRPVVTPTGLESNHTKPYALMVGAGALAGLALVGGILARRARRRREW